MPRHELTALSVSLPVLGTGSKLPGRAIDNAELLDSVANFITLQDARLGMRIGSKLGVRSRHVSHLILDLRDNGGGSDEASDGLIRYLADTTIRPLRAVRRRTIAIDSTLAAAFDTWGDRTPIFSPPPASFDTDTSGWYSNYRRTRSRKRCRW